MRWLPIVLPLGLALAGGIYLAVVLLMDLSSIRLDDLDAACDLSCECDDCVFWRLTDEALAEIERLRAELAERDETAIQSRERSDG